MSNVPRKNTTTDLETGQMEPVGEQPSGLEPPIPHSLPEFPEPGGTTGKTPVVDMPEGEDITRLQDDSATKSSHERTVRS